MHHFLNFPELQEEPQKKQNLTQPWSGHCNNGHKRAENAIIFQWSRHSYPAGAQIGKSKELSKSGCMLHLLSKLWPALGTRIDPICSNRHSGRAQLWAESKLEETRRPSTHHLDMELEKQRDLSSIIRCEKWTPLSHPGAPLVPLRWSPARSRNMFKLYSDCSSLAPSALLCSIVMHVGRSANILEALLLYNKLTCKMVESWLAWTYGTPNYEIPKGVCLWRVHLLLSYVCANAHPPLDSLDSLFGKPPGHQKSAAFSVGVALRSNTMHHDAFKWMANKAYHQEKCPKIYDEINVAWTAVWTYPSHFVPALKPHIWGIKIWPLDVFKIFDQPLESLPQQQPLPCLTSTWASPRTRKVAVMPAIRMASVSKIGKSLKLPLIDVSLPQFSTRPV